MNNTETFYVDFLRDCDGDKLVWIMTQLSESNIPNKLNGRSINGFVLQVPQGHLGLALSVYHQPIGEFLVGLENTTITISDLPNNHEFFTLDYRPGTVTTPAETYQPADPEAIEVEHTVVDATIEDVTIIAETSVPIELSLEEAVPEPEIGKTIPPAKHGKKPQGASLASGEMKPPTGVVVDDFDSAWDWDDDDDGEPVPKTAESVLKDAEAVGVQHLPHCDMMIQLDPAKSKLVTCFEVMSTNLSRLAAHVLPNDTEKLVVYVGFKGSEISYRYYPISPEVYTEGINEAIKKTGDPKTASIGQWFWEQLRNRADVGDITCQRYAGDGQWAVVHPSKKKGAK